jgi:hypothetical protein
MEAKLMGEEKMGESIPNFFIFFYFFVGHSVFALLSSFALSHYLELLVAVICLSSCSYIGSGYIQKIRNLFFLLFFLTKLAKRKKKMPLSEFPLD